MTAVRLQSFATLSEDPHSGPPGTLGLARPLAANDTSRRSDGTQG